MLGRWEVHIGMSSKKPTSLEEALDVLQPRIVRAVQVAHQTYERLGIRHALGSVFKRADCSINSIGY